jgi:hypothetical protein
VYVTTETVARRGQPGEGRSRALTTTCTCPRGQGVAASPSMPMFFLDLRVLEVRLVRVRSQRVAWTPNTMGIKFISSFEEKRHRADVQGD